MNDYAFFFKSDTIFVSFFSVLILFSYSLVFVVLLVILLPILLILIIVHSVTIRV